MNRKSKLRSSSESISFKVGFLRIAAEVHRAPDLAAPTILALHGFTGSSADWDPLRCALGPDTAHWICPDWPGHGRSGAPDVVDPYQLPTCLQLLRHAAGSRSPNSRLVLLGYSMGGRIAWHFLRHHRVDTAILIGASPGIADPVERARRRQQDARWIRLLLRHGIHSFCKHWEEQKLIAPQTCLPEPLRSAVARRRRAQNPVGLAHSLQAVGSGNLPSLEIGLPHSPPAHLVSGQLDTRFKNLHQNLASRYPQLTPHTIPNAGHAPHLENPTGMARCLRTLL